MRFRWRKTSLGFLLVNSTLAQHAQRIKGNNDPFSAIRCIDQLSVGLSYLAQREVPSPYGYDDDHNLRVIAEPIAFTGLTDTDSAFYQR